MDNTISFSIAELSHKIAAARTRTPILFYPLYIPKYFCLSFRLVYHILPQNSTFYYFVCTNIHVICFWVEDERNELTEIRECNEVE